MNGWRCTSDRCGWTGLEPAAQEYQERVEFWGSLSFETFVERSCPLCGDDVEECLLCERCNDQPAEDFDDYCARCAQELGREVAA